jgi:hypothetical protein
MPGVGPVATDVQRLVLRGHREGEHR